MSQTESKLNDSIKKKKNVIKLNRINLLDKQNEELIKQLEIYINKHRELSRTLYNDKQNV